MDHQGRGRVTLTGFVRPNALIMSEPTTFGPLTRCRTAPGNPGQYARRQGVDNARGAAGENPPRPIYRFAQTDVATCCTGRAFGFASLWEWRRGRRQGARQDDDGTQPNGLLINPMPARRQSASAAASIRTWGRSSQR